MRMLVAAAECDHPRAGDWPCLRALHQRPPIATLAFDRPFAADGDVVQSLAGDEALAAGIFVHRQHLQHGAFVESQIDLVGKLERPGEKLPRRHFDHAPTRRDGGVDRLLDRLGVIRRARRRPMIGNLKDRVRNLRQCRSVGGVVGARRAYATQRETEERASQVDHAGSVSNRSPAVNNDGSCGQRYLRQIQSIGCSRRFDAPRRPAFGAAIRCGAQVVAA